MRVDQAVDRGLHFVGVILERDWFIGNKELSSTYGVVWSQRQIL